MNIVTILVNCFSKHPFLIPIIRILIRKRQPNYILIIPTKFIDYYILLYWTIGHSLYSLLE